MGAGDRTDAVRDRLGSCPDRLSCRIGSFVGKLGGLVAHLGTDGEVEAAAGECRSAHQQQGGNHQECFLHRIEFW